MGSTVSAVYFTDKTFIVANVGDSPVYLVQNGNIELISVSHTVAAEHAALYGNESQKFDCSLSVHQPFLTK